MSLHDVHHDEWVAGYNGYQCAVFEVYVPTQQLAVSCQSSASHLRRGLLACCRYCKGCDLFLGHQFADAKEKGDRHPQAHWRH